MARRTTERPKVGSMTDEELSAHLAELHDWQRELLDEVDAASREVERRSAEQSEAAVIRGLPENVRDMLGKASSLPSHIKHALVEAEAAQANGQGNATVEG